MVFSATKPRQANSSDNFIGLFYHIIERPKKDMSDSRRTAVMILVSFLIDIKKKGAVPFFFCREDYLKVYIIYQLYFGEVFSFS